MKGTGPRNKDRSWTITEERDHAHANTEMGASFVPKRRLHFAFALVSLIVSPADIPSELKRFAWEGRQLPDAAEVVALEFLHQSPLALLCLSKTGKRPKRRQPERSSRSYASCQRSILTANGNDGNLVVTKPNGVRIETILLDSAGAGVLFGLTAVPGQGVYFVDDGTNKLDLLH